jgi:hypothetical protein
MKNSYFLLFLAGIVLALSGCGETITTNIEISQNGEPYLIPVQEFDGTVTWPEITENEVMATLEYVLTRDQIRVDQQAAIEPFLYFVEQNHGVVNGQEYPYVLVIPIASSHKIKSKRINNNKNLQQFDGDRCSENILRSVADFFSMTSDNEPQLVGDEFFYNLYIPYNKIASTLVLNNITDICIDYYYSSGPDALEFSTADSYIAKSNTLVIPAEEIKQALDYWNIPHELPQE